MPISRLRRYEEKKLKKRFVLAIFGSLAVLTFLLIFGLKLLVGFSLFVEKFKAGGPAAKPTPTVILPPTLKPLPEATNSATITVNGNGQPGLTLILYLNGSEYKKLPVDKDGNFTFENLPVNEGKNLVSAKLTDDKGNISDLSNILTVTIELTAPSLTVNSPADNATINGDQNSTNVSGLVKDDSVTVTINGRLAVVNSDGSFQYAFRLSNGGNTLEIKATDAAGNVTTVTRHVTYQP